MPANLIVRGDQLSFNGKTYCCAIGKGGFSRDKKEGDGATPIGTFALRECWYRADHVDAPETQLPLRVITKQDGWCDDPKSPDYNRHIILPPPQGGEGYSYECLWRDDHVYDLIIPLGYNDDPVVPGRGSAIFLHLAHDDYRPTEGCIALAKADFLAILPDIRKDTYMQIKE